MSNLYQSAFNLHYLRVRANWVLENLVLRSNLAKNVRSSSSFPEWLAAAAEIACVIKQNSVSRKRAAR
ncbi:MAG: hypothetical protein AUG81_03950 [Verrucomicrobia bacterium 13_1_20CM_4_54_11]|nr:MAG: hypothetical protein AUG81_03950 [Verrucomicrobia bacterium 13_1_20CM_4_54_11]OLE10741.1 MAG: hypothetical protein AUG52_08985 [Verrucomicrobia bacterium 13_1_20CM_3_54_17]